MLAWPTSITCAGVCIHVLGHRGSAKREINAFVLVNKIGGFHKSLTLSFGDCRELVN